jgi:hypothetical protein
MTSITLEDGHDQLIGRRPLNAPSALIMHREAVCICTVAIFERAQAPQLYDGKPQVISKDLVDVPASSSSNKQTDRVALCLIRHYLSKCGNKGERGARSRRSELPLALRSLGL